MLTNSQLIHHNQAIIPHLVIEALKLRDGDAIVFEIDQAGVHLRKVPRYRSSLCRPLKTIRGGRAFSVYASKRQ